MTTEEINALRNALRDGNWALYFWLELSEWEKREDTLTNFAECIRYSGKTSLAPHVKPNKK